MEKTASFNLIDEPWIWVLMHDGSRQELSLEKVFEEAPRIKCLANDLPTQDFAILRMLLAILQRSLVDVAAEYDLPSDLWAGLWEARSEGLPVDEIHGYLEQWHDRFDLFDANHPFMQVAGMHTKNNEWREVRQLIPDSDGKNPLFVMRTGNGASTLDYDEAARWLLHVQAYDTGGIKTGVEGDSTARSGRSFSNKIGWAGRLGGVYLEGENFAETLILCFVPAFDSWEMMFPVDDCPAWERDQALPDGTARLPAGQSDIFTWQSRRVALHEKDGVVDGVIVTKGDNIDNFNMVKYEPMTSWRRLKSPKSSKEMPVFKPYMHKSTRALWQGLETLLPLVSVSDFVAPNVVRWLGYLMNSYDSEAFRQGTSACVRAVGFEYLQYESYGDSATKYGPLINDSLTFSLVLASEKGRTAAETARTCVKKTDEAVYALGLMASRIERASGADSVASGNAGKAVREIKSRAYFELDLIFRRWLSSLDDEVDPVEAQLSWNNSARRVLVKLANDLIASAEPRSIIGRVIDGKQISAPEAERFFYRSLDKALPTSAEGIGDAEEGSRNV